ncbi:hypothetical protein HNQ87_000872 [Pacificimonas flava]|uniref:Sugar transporter n=1 Tax=Pacificimonas flava TaxID=1234595 RepID=M2U8U2_9SPHN|nr:sugar transporter [Pacificimonas flava]MBB5279725.1 hypothetical protein [Pacificimonas flava]
MRLVQIRLENGDTAVVRSDDPQPYRVPRYTSVLTLAAAAIKAKQTLVSFVEALPRGETVDIAAALADGRIAAPISHPDPAHLHLTGTGLTHLGSADARDKMHKEAAAGAVTDSVRMFLLGTEGGKPAEGATGVQPEWFYKGDGLMLVDPGADLPSPSFALDGSEEPEIAGVYLIGEGGRVHRIGFALANEFSDHVTEQQNYLYLAHSKLRSASLGPELLVGELPHDIRGTSSVVRDGEAIWQAPFLSGEQNMSHSIANLEHHHFKYAQFRRPGDVHVHFFGTATLSFAAGVRCREGDRFRIEAAPFGLPLENPLRKMPENPVSVQPL